MKILFALVAVAGMTAISSPVLAADHAATLKHTYSSNGIDRLVVDNRVGKCEFVQEPGIRMK